MDEFEDPIELPNGRKLITLRYAATYVTQLPKADHTAPQWQAAMQALILVAENGGPTILPRIGVMKAMNHGVERVFRSDRKEMRWGKRKTEEGYHHAAILL
jgi:hypothetical protein